MSEIKLGIFGARRGLSFARSAASRSSDGLVLKAICDFSDAKIKQAAEDFNVDFYNDFDKMLKADIDAVVLANYFHEHAPFAVKAIEAGLDVMSETIPAATMAEAVLLCEAVEKTGRTYMFAENYPFTKTGLAMKKEYAKGTIGSVLFAEGEYIHPIKAPDFNRLSPGENHWRNWIPSTYYCTHALAPLMFMTGLKPVRVNALSIADEILSKGTARRNDPLAVILCTMDNGSVFRITGWGTAGGHSVRYRLIGEYGTIESPRHHEGGYFKNGMLNITLNELRNNDSEPHIRSYMPEWPEEAKDAEKAGHGGGDYFMNGMFTNAIRTGNQPEYFDVYDGAAMSAVAILAWRSALEDGRPYDIPDFHDKKDRDKFRNDLASPFADYPDRPRIQPSVKGERTPSEDDMEAARRDWESR